MATLRNRRWFRYLSHVCRIIFAIVFIFSGFVKAIDPWGTALNVNNYLAAYNLEVLKPFVMIFSIWLCGAELMMGCMLLFKVRIRLISIFAVLSMTFFTILTFLSATFIPVEDCGCFGEAIKMTPWQTFAKNLVLYPMALCFWYRYRPDKIFSFTRLELVLTVFFFTFAMSVGTYSYYHLPLFDFLPYKRGTNIAEEMDKARAGQVAEEVVLVYRNRRTGKIKEFSLTDKAWHNDKKWEWVETRVEENSDSVEPMILEFYISDEEGDKTDSLLSTSGRLYMLFVSDFERLDEDIAERMGAVVRHAAIEDTVICLTPEPLGEGRTITFAGAPSVKCYNMDAKTMKTILRADFGLVELEEGVVVEKFNYRDIPYGEQ